MVVKEGETRSKKTHIADIHGRAEREFFLLIEGRFPDATIEYEPKRFLDPDGIRSTLPDFCIRRKNRPPIYVEITTEERGGKDKIDPKEKQKEIMRKYPNVKYVVLYMENLESIERKHPRVHFFNGKKMEK